MGSPGLPVGLELRHLRYFVAVADRLNFTTAAKALNIAQPALSQQIRALERLIGVDLFIRRPQVQLTDAGHAFLASARHTLADAAAAVDQAQRVTTGGAEQVTVGFASTIMLSPLRRVFATFARQHPKVHLVIREMHSTAQPAALRNGTLDVAITRELVQGTDLTSELLLEEPLVIMMPARHRLSRRARVGARDLLTEPIILFPRSVASTLYDQIERWFIAAGVALHPRYEANEWHTITGLVASGLGVSIAPASVQTLRWPGVRYQALTPRVRATVLFLCHDPRRATAAARDFLLATRALADLPIRSGAR
jgi:DNA-binding transcriptional LysR family regulator